MKRVALFATEERRLHTGAMLGEHRLMIAVLEDACHTLSKYHRVRRSREAKRLFSEALGWFEDPTQGGLFSLESICEALGLDSEAVRDVILARYDDEADETRDGSIPSLRIKRATGGSRTVVTSRRDHRATRKTAGIQVQG